MKKILDLLEQKVQWIALALGVAYVLYMTWAYVLQPPVTAEVGGNVVGPGEVDAKVEEIAVQLDQRVTSTALPAEMPQPQQYVADFKSELDYGGKLPGANPQALLYHVSGRVKLPDVPNMPNIPLPLPGVLPGGQPGGIAGTPVGPGGIDAPLTGPVEKLPTLATPTITHTLSGLSNVNPTPDPGNAAGAEVAGVDKSWVTVRFELDVDALAAQWDPLRFPNTAAATSFLQVTLTRQEQQSDGSWGKDTVIPPLAFHNIPGFPPAGPPSTAHYDYIKWAAARTPVILQPAFFPVLKGDPWYIPGETAPTQSRIAAFDPAQFVDETDPKKLELLNMEQRRAVSALREQRRREQNRGRGSGGRAQPAPRGGAAPIDNFSVADPDRPVSYQPVDVDAPVDLDPIDLPQPAAGGAPATPAARIVTVVGAGQGKFQHPSGEFDPRNWIKEHAGKPVIGWAHDATAVAGATYRYKVSIAIKNPVFGNKLAVKQAALMEPLAVRSSDSGWSSPVDVASPVSFFVGGTPRDATGSVPIDVFRIQGGEPHRKVFQTTVGDPIGGMDGNVDYSTGWTLIDFVKDPRPASPEWHIILMDSRGTIRRRLMTEDAKDARYLRLKEQASMPSAAAAR